MGLTHDLKMPNFFLGLLRVAAWLLWREPVATLKPKRSGEPSRVPVLGFTTGPTPDGIHSVVRLAWFRKGRPVEVDEFQIEECPDAEQIFQYTVGQALRRGADVCVLTTYEPEELGVPVNGQLT